MSGKAKDKKDLRDETILFKVTKDEKKMIEDFVKSKRGDWTVSEYLRVAVLFDMIIEGHLPALKQVASGIGEKLGEKLKRYFRPSTEGLKIKLDGN